MKLKMCAAHVCNDHVLVFSGEVTETLIRVIVVLHCLKSLNLRVLILS